MMQRSLRAAACAAAVTMLATGPAAPAEIAPHRALYTMSLGVAKSNSGVTSAHAARWPINGARPATAGPSSSATS